MKMKMSRDYKLVCHHLMRLAVDAMCASDLLIRTLMNSNGELHISIYSEPKDGNFNTEEPPKLFLMDVRYSEETLIKVYTECRDTLEGIIKKGRKNG